MRNEGKEKKKQVEKTFETLVDSYKSNNDSNQDDDYFQNIRRIVVKHIIQQLQTGLDVTYAHGKENRVFEAANQFKIIQ